MTEPVSFAALLTEAARLFFKQRLFLVFIVFFGITALLNAHFVQKILPTEEVSPENLFSWIRENIIPALTLLGLSLFFVFINAFIRGPLLILTEDTLLSENFSRSKKAKIFQYLRAGQKTLRIEFFYSLLLLSLALILSLPVILAWKENSNVLPFVFNLATFLFFGIFVLFYFIKEYTLFYQILAGTPIRIALDLGYALFRKYLSLSLIFGLLLITLFLCFTFILDSVIIWSTQLFRNIPFSSSVFVLLFSGFFSVYENILQLLFFHSLATEKKKPEVTKVIQEEVLEIPS